MRRILILPIIALALMAVKPFEQLFPAPDSFIGIRVASRSQNLPQDGIYLDELGSASLQTDLHRDSLFMAGRQAATPTPKPTGTPIPTPPPANPAENNMMIFFVVIAVLVVIVGVWINRQRTWRA